MPVINFRINKVNAEKNELDSRDIDNVDVSSNFSILSIGRKKDKDIGEYLRVNFKFFVSYTPNLGEIKMDGFLWYSDKNIDKIATEKNGKMEIKPEVVEEISTAILRDSLLEALDMSRKLRLPIPVKLPKVTVKSKKELVFPKAT
jgi:hypothetical protein